MPGVSDLGSVVSSVAATEIGPGPLVFASFIVDEAPMSRAVPSLTRTERAMCEALSPSQFTPIEVDDTKPVSERIADAFGQLWDQIEVADALALVMLDLKYQQTMASVLVDDVKRESYLTSMGTAYSDYVKDYFEGYVELFKLAGKAIARNWECQLALFEVSTEALLAAVAGTVDFAALLLEVQQKCPELMTVATAMAELHAWFVVLRDNPGEVLLAVAEMLGEIIVAVLEVIRDKDIIGMLNSVAEDVEAIGQVHGMLVGFIVADIVIDELLTLGMGKVAKGVRWVVRATN